MSYNDRCESCAGGTDLSPGAKCDVCGNHNEITGYRKCEYPMTKGEEDLDIPITSINN